MDPMENITTHTTIQPNTNSDILALNYGIFGHVDSGKTSISKLISTLASTAAFDKHPDSKKRCITTDLGFSSFSLPLPETLSTHYSSTICTIVDCPGHAQFIKTIMGGSSIVDHAIMVIDINKGIQTQTAECFVLAAISTDNLTCIFNKIDTFQDTVLKKANIKLESEVTNFICHDLTLKKIEKKITLLKKTLSKSFPKFSRCDVIPMSAKYGFGLSKLVNALSQSITPPTRDLTSPFYANYDHSFSIKGQGTVFTCTIIQGCISVGDLISLSDYPDEKLKIKSIQTFKSSRKSAIAGDRCGICISLNNKTNKSRISERGFLFSPQSITFTSRAFCYAHKVDFFTWKISSNTKFNIIFGHISTLAHVVFFRRLRLQLSKQHQDVYSDETFLYNHNFSVKQAQNANITNIFIQQKEFSPYVILSSTSHMPFIHQPKIQPKSNIQHHPDAPFDQNIPQPINFIASRLNLPSSSKKCKLAFYGKIIQALNSPNSENNAFYVSRTKIGRISSISKDHANPQESVILHVTDLFLRNYPLDPFLGKNVYFPSDPGSSGTIIGSHGPWTISGIVKIQVEPDIAENLFVGNNVHYSWLQNYKSHTN